MAVSASPVGASGPADHFTENVAGDTIACGSRVYTVTSGTIKITVHEGESASGNQNFTGTVTPRGVVATSGGKTYAVRGAFWFGGTFNAQQGTGQQGFTGKLQIVAPGTGKVDSVNITFHVAPDGTVKAFDMGTCAEPS